MMAAKLHSGLGRGLGELFARTDLPAADVVDSPRSGDPVVSSAPMPDGSYFAHLPVDAITPNPRQPRGAFDPDSMAELVSSITAVGVLQPVVVRAKPGGYELIMGERRWRACRDAGLASVPAIVRATEDAALLRDALLENLHRAELNPLEEAAAYQQMLEDFDCTQDELATRVMRSRPHISNTIRLLKLPASVQRRIAAGALTAGHARALLALTDPAAQERLAQRIVAEGLSVRATEQLVALGERVRLSRAVRQRTPDTRAVELSTRLSDRFDTRVRVDIGRSKGKIVIEFASPDDLERILALVDSTRREQLTAPAPEAPEK